MSITDELRTGGIYRFPSNSRVFTEEELTAIADRIDAEHESACGEAYGNGVMSVPIALDESQWVRLPVDADGLPIHVGDEVVDVDCPKEQHLVAELRLDSISWSIFMGRFTLLPSRCRHVQPDTWERILDAAAKLSRGDNGAVMELVERCRRLAGEDA